MNFSSMRTVIKIKDAVIKFFKKIFEFATTFNSESRGDNLKNVALISCLSLIALLVVAIMGRRNSRLTPPPTPTPIKGNLDGK